MSESQVYPSPTMDEKDDKDTPRVDPTDSDPENSIEIKPTEEPSAAAVHDFPEGGARAWSVAIGAAGALFCTFGYANAFGVFQEYYETHQLKNTSPSTISWIGSIQIFFLFGGNLFGGPLFDRFGVKVIWPPAFTYLLSVFMTSLCKEYYQFFLAQGVLGGISMGMVMAPAMASIGQYFHKNRGAAMGLAVGGSSLGGVIFPIVLSKTLNNPKISFGWSVRITGFIMLPLMLIGCATIRARLPPRNGTFFLPRAFKNPVYLGLIGSIFLGMMGVFMPFFYLPTFGVAHGMSTELASYIVAILNGASFFGRVIPGVLGDRVGRLNMLVGAAMCTGILILCMQALRSNASIIVFSGLYGFFSGAIVSGMTVAFATVPDNPREIGTYMGMAMACTSIAALIGPPIDGVFVKKFEGFDQVAIFSGVVVLAASLGVLGVKTFLGKGLFAKE